MNARDVEAMFVRLSKLESGKRQYTDTSNAERLLEKHGKDIRYCPEWNQWLCWDGKRWRKGRAVEMHARAKEIVRDMYGEACCTESEWEREELEKHALKCEGIHRRKAMVEVLSWERAVWISPEELDRDIWLLNCGNGTVDLRTGELRPHERSDYITKIANADYVRDADCPRWKRFLSEVMGGNESLVEFLQRAGGCALTGSTKEQKLFVLHGSGANASLLVAGLSRLGFSFLVGCAPGVDERFRYTLSLSAVTEEHTFVACAFERRAAEIGRTGLFASLVVPDGVCPRAALRRRTLWLVKRADRLMLFPDDPETGRWGRGSALAFRAALDQLKPAFVVTTRPPARSLSYHLLPDRFFGFLDGWWVVPHPVALTVKAEVQDEAMKKIIEGGHPPVRYDKLYRAELQGEAAADERKVP